MCVFLFVTLCSLCLTVFLPPLPEVQCTSFIDIWNPWRKVMERNGLIFEFFAKNCVQLPRQKVFYGFFSSNFFTPFNGPFAHTSRSPMSKTFRYIVLNLNIFPQKLCKNNAKQKFFLRIFFICSLRLQAFLPPLPEVQCPSLF